MAALRLEDIDWRRGEIAVVGKGNRHERLPLPVDVGEALVFYLNGSRPATTANGEVFLGPRAPHRALTRSSYPAGGPRRTPVRAGDWSTPYWLRHTAATTMLRGRVPGGDRAAAAPPARAVHRRLCEGRSRTATLAGAALAR